MGDMKEKAERADWASIKMATMESEQKERALLAIAEALWRERETIQKANKEDLIKLQDLQREREVSTAVVKRLMLDEEKIRQVVEMVRDVANLEDPVGKTLYAVELDEGLELYRVSSPIGVIAVIFESRPDALPQIASLCLKSGNSVLLKGGSEASNSNRTLFNVIRRASLEAGYPEGWIQLMEAREEVAELLKLDEYVDLIIPRGSNSFVRYIEENTKIPVLGHSEGVCHIYVDRDADIEKAVKVCLDAKVQYPAVCNAVDTLLVHKEIAEGFLPRMLDRFKEFGVEVWGCSATARILGEGVKLATEDDWGAEYLDYVVAVNVVSDMEEAIQHVNRYGSHHTDSIITRCGEAALKFMEEVDSASVFWNASTRFADGYRYGLGAEVGISTGKIHARGPTGLDGLLIYKYYLVGSNQVVSSYVDSLSSSFKHRRLSKTWEEVRNQILRER